MMSDSPDLDDSIRQTFVVPFYLSWMEQNALTREAESQIDALRSNAQALSETGIRHMLRIPWRDQVMGAWYAAARADLPLADAVHESVAQCHGTLTAAPLCVAAIRHATADTPTVLANYRDWAVEHRDGSVSIVSAAINHLQPDGPASRESLEDVWTGTGYQKPNDALSSLLLIAGRLGTLE